MMNTFMWGGGFEAMFSVVFVLIIGVFVVAIIKGIGEWNWNNQSPRLTVDATVAAKRISVTHHQHANAGDASRAHGFHTTTITDYFVTFQVESGDRMEFQVNSSEYGMLAEQDEGRLSFQGSRYLGFERKV